MNTSLARAWKELGKEASADVVERRRIAEADVELSLVKMQHDKLRYDEEQAATLLKHEEQRQTDKLATEREQARAAHELALRATHEKEMLELNEASQRRINSETFDAEKERLQLQLKAANERARLEAEAKIRDKRENADVYMKELEAQALADRAKLLAAIAESVEQARGMVKELYGQPENLAWGVGSLVALFAGIYLAREMSTLLREQLNKRLGRPSLVRRTSRRSLIGDIGRAFKRIFRRCCCCGRCPVRPEKVF